ncbi:MAG: hypothetical protein QW645_01840, partial [Candidatus Bathyarchaeia archaeon]
MNPEYALRVPAVGPRLLPEARADPPVFQRELIAAQAEALGLSLLQWPTGDDTYEADFLSALKELKARGAVGVIFGDMFPEGHREWGQRMCAAAGLQAHHPLFGWDTHQALKTFLAAGYKAVIVSGRP